MGVRVPPPAPLFKRLANLTPQRQSRLGLRSETTEARTLKLDPVESVEALVVIDNVTDSLSSVPSFVETEFAGLRRRRHGRWILGGSCLCCAAHGLSCLITIRNGNRTATLLFDTGPEDRTFEQNVSRLGADLGLVEAIVLSHGHWDHGGAMLRALQMIRDRNGGRDIPCYVHPDMFWTRAVKQPNGAMQVMEDVPSVAALAAYGGEAVNTREAQILLEGMAYVSSEIPRVTPFERGFLGQHRRKADGGWELDELIMDERFVAVNVKDKGIVVFTACSHAGVVNVLKHARTCFQGVPLHAVVGGLHLSGANERIIGESVAAMGEFDLQVIAAGHCTGWRAMTALANSFGEAKLVPLSVGKRFSFRSGE